MNPRSAFILLMFLATLPSHSLNAAPVTWSHDLGGNGNTYEVIPGIFSWSAANTRAKALGGHLATITSDKENDFVYNLTLPYWSTLNIDNRWWNYGPWLGGEQVRGPEPGGGWRWVTGPPAGSSSTEFLKYEDWWTRWNSGEPNNGDNLPGQQENKIHYFNDGRNSTPSTLPTWNDINPAAARNGGIGLPFIVEYEEASIVFREESLNGAWLNELIPGWDHVGLNYIRVLESHPGYFSGTFEDPDTGATVTIDDVRGVQAQHTDGTFRLDYLELGSQNDRIEISRQFVLVQREMEFSL